MSKFKVGDKLVALESVKSVRLFIPQQQLDILPRVIATVTEAKESGSFRITFDGCDSHSGGWSFGGVCSKHFVKIPSVGDVVTGLVVPEAKSLNSINIVQMATGANPVGGIVTSSKPRTDGCWAPQSVFLSTGYSWPVSWLRFKYQDEQVAKEEVTEVEKSFSALKVGDKVRFKSRNLSELKGRWNSQHEWCGEPTCLGWPKLKDDHIFTVTMARDYTSDNSPDVHITSNKTPGTWFSFACDLVLVEDEPVGDTSSKAGESTKVKLTKQQKSAKRLLKHLCKAKLESRVLLDLTPTSIVGKVIGDVNVSKFVCSIHEPKGLIKQITRELGIEQEGWQLKA